LSRGGCIVVRHLCGTRTMRRLLGGHFVFDSLRPLMAGCHPIHHAGGRSPLPRTRSSAGGRDARVGHPKASARCCAQGATVGSLGQAAVPHSPMPTLGTHGMETEGMSAKRFRIAFSFAGEKRSFVARVAAILAQRFTESKILYDQYHEAEFG